MNHSEEIKPGDYVRFHTMPPGVTGRADETLRIFRYCLGRIYRVDEIDSNGLLVLDVSADCDRVFGGFMNDIRVEAEFVSKVPKPTNVSERKR